MFDNNSGYACYTLCVGLLVVEYVYSTQQFFFFIILVPSRCLVLRDNENCAKKITIAIHLSGILLSVSETALWEHVDK